MKKFRIEVSVDNYKILKDTLQIDDTVIDELLLKMSVKQNTYLFVQADNLLMATKAVDTNYYKIEQIIEC